MVAHDFVRVQLGEAEVGLRFEDGVLVEVLPPATRRLYWKACASCVWTLSIRLSRPSCRPRCSSA